MVDYEKVVGNLQILRTWCAVNPRHGMGLDSGECEKAVGWLDDALELLKAQQPRMLTVEEVKVSEGKDLILEYRPWGCEDGIVTAATIEGCGRKGVLFAMSVMCDYLTYNRKYPMGWRCWSARPTDEQRKAVVWDDAE